MKTGGYIDGLKEAKRLVSEGRAQLKSAKRLECSADDTEFVGLYGTSDKIRDISGAKEEEAIGKIARGLEIYRSLLSYENLPHFPRVKTAIGSTITEFEENLPFAMRERCYNALFIGPE